MKAVSKILFFLLFIVILYGCEFFEINTAAELTAITITNESFYIDWNPPGDIENVTDYNVYVKPYNAQQSWELLGTVAESGDETCSFEINDQILEFGSYIFSVTSVTSDGTESDYHTSLDSSAEPVNGWYIIWG